MKLYDCGITLFIVIVGAILVANVMTEVMKENHQPKNQKVLVRIQHQIK